MATVDELKQALRQSAAAAATPPERQPLSDAQSSAGLAVVASGSGWATHKNFIIPQLSDLIASLTASQGHVSVLEVGPGPQSVLGHLPERLRRKIRRYVAFEPNILFAARLEEWLRSPSKTLYSPPEIHRTGFSLQTITENLGNGERFDIVVFCHSMYGMTPHMEYVVMALELLVNEPKGGMVVVFHRYGSLEFKGLVSHRTAMFPNGTLRVADDDESLGHFAPFVAGFHLPSADADKALMAEWRARCRALGRREPAHPGLLTFDAPEIMVAFTRHATALAELAEQVPLAGGNGDVKNREARLHRPAAVVRPTDIGQVQTCVRWALEHDLSLTVLSGGHSGHCIWPHAVAVDMRSFDQIHIVAAGGDGDDGREASTPLLVVGTGCKTGDIIREAATAGLTVPLGARPSVGAGLWFQGGIGHLARLHGLACDAIVGAVIVSASSGQLFCVGRVPRRHQPAGAERPDNENDLLWALQGAGTNCGIVISVTFKTYPAPIYVVRSRVESMTNIAEAQRKLRHFDEKLAGILPRTCSADAYLYGVNEKLMLGVTTFETGPSEPGSERPNGQSPTAALMGEEASTRTVDGVGLFDCDMYMTEMHGGHGGGKTSSFKRCVFLKDVGSAPVSQALAAAVENRPSPQCYLHLLHGGGAVGDTAARATAFGVRDWAFACVITAVWPRAEDGTAVARACTRWVYDVAAVLLPLAAGVYGADLGPDPRDAALAAHAFGPNRPRLARLKRRLDPRRVLAAACPLPARPLEPGLILLVTGDCGAGKDFCARVWAAALAACPERKLTVRVASISDRTKREYAAETGADLARLLQDRAYKEQHRPALTAFFQRQQEQRPQLPAEHFLETVYDAGGVDVLLITGMRDEAPVATFSPLVPDSRLLDVRVRARLETRAARRGLHGAEGHTTAQVKKRSQDDGDDNNDAGSDGPPTRAPLAYCPSFVLDNDEDGEKAAMRFAEKHLWPFWHADLQRLARMVRTVPDFPRAGIAFRDVLGIAEQAGGLALCASLLQQRLYHHDQDDDDQFPGGWTNVGVVACCEAGGFLVAPALAARVGVPLALIRDAGKRPPPAVAVVKPPSHISYSASNGAPQGASKTRMEMGRDVMPRGRGRGEDGGGGGVSVVVVDDVLATGDTLCAVLQLLQKAGTRPEDVSVLVVAEFPAHGGRARLRERGFGRVRIHSLLVYGGR